MVHANDKEPFNRAIACMIGKDLNYRPYVIKKGGTCPFGSA